MRVIAIALLAACGGSSAPSPTTPTAPRAPANAEEDWRGVLSQWVGTWSFDVPPHTEQTCSWLGTFVACASDDTLTLLGYEPINRRYIAWVFYQSNVATFSGTAGVSAWDMSAGNAHLTWTRTSPTVWKQHAEMSGHVEERTLTATVAPGPPPPAPASPPASSIDWRSELQSLVGHWTFSGTAAGQPFTYSEDCDWLPASTFVVCKNVAMQQISLTGWEPQNQAFATYGFAGGQTHLLGGKVENHNWTFTDGKATLTMTRVSPLEYQLKGTAPTGETFEGSYTTKPE